MNSKWNAYYNPDKASPNWADELIDATTVGHHTVGELKDVTRTANKLIKSQLKKGQSPNMVAQTKTKDYVVKDKDTLWKIAGKKMSKVQQIKKLNGLKSDKIQPGQILKVPA